MAGQIIEAARTMLELAVVLAGAYAMFAATVTSL